MNFQAIVKRINPFIDFFIPRMCISCKGLLHTGNGLLCTKCFDELEKIPAEKIETLFTAAFGESHLVSKFYPLFEFVKDSPIQSLLHELKYNSKFRVGIELGKMIAERYADDFSKEHVDFIIPIPLHRVKKAERGYNQSFYIAKGISRVTGIPLNSKLVGRKKFTQSQTTFSREERILNLKNAFKAKDKQKIKNKSILIVDDVVTTGSTTNECARVLLKAGAKKICVTSAAAA